MARGTINEARKGKAHAGLSKMASESRAAEKAAKVKRHRMFAGMLKAFNAGLTYEEIAEITGLSKIRVSQVLREQREAKA